MDDFIITTTPNVEGYVIEKYCGIVSDSCFFLIYDQESFSELIKKAQLLGANAIVGLVINVYSNVSGSHGCDTNAENQAYGTAVRIRKK